MKYLFTLSIILLVINCKDKKSIDLLLHNNAKKKWDLIQYNNHRFEEIVKVWEFRQDGNMYRFRVNAQGQLVKEDFGDQVFDDTYELRVNDKEELFIDMYSTSYLVEKITTDTLVLLNKDLKYVFESR
ncbi:hypothetical protein [Nonlabens xiamenensis]|uniref:hypothetical protein n=1 Tax=Nonlabens xiamenensis TaxID=2341043 RepID=UPI000F610513|nr:hypothetical protein [Nonlabens xiamenensis]